MIVPFAAGGASDVIARAVAEQMGTALGQTIVIENVAGAGGSTALTRAARAEPDGYTIAIGNAGTNAASYTIYPKTAVHASDLVCADRAWVAKDLRHHCDPQGFSGEGSEGVHRLRQGQSGQNQSRPCRRRLVELPHLQRSFVHGRQAIDATLVGYRGASPALTDAIGGQIDGVCDAAASVSQSINEKLVRGLVVGSTVRLATSPDLPTSAEAGLPEFEAQGWNGLFAPKGTRRLGHHRQAECGRACTAVETDAVKKRALPKLSTVAPDDGEHHAGAAPAAR